MKCTVGILCIILIMSASGNACDILFYNDAFMHVHYYSTYQTFVSVLWSSVVKTVGAPFYCSSFAIVYNGIHFGYGICSYLSEKLKSLNLLTSNKILYSSIMSVVGQYFLSVLVNYWFLGTIKCVNTKVCPKFHLYLHTHACMHELYYTIYYAHWDCMHCKYIMYTVITLTHSVIMNQTLSSRSINSIQFSHHYRMFQSIQGPISTILVACINNALNSK